MSTCVEVSMCVTSLTKCRRVGWDGMVTQKGGHLTDYVGNLALLLDLTVRRPNGTRRTSMLCVRIVVVGGKDACQGDSDGPLAHQRVNLVGIISWGYRCSDPLQPGVNIRVSQFIDWILVHA
ncbi:trypsin-like [Bombyx mori]|uniref:Peptidase S1 domain-containing protein n=1 Tax=Bombyx mori TaxID=7091 RepID=A0A8R2R074_BOMMO|nr:trypsin-like [Bombyx mori]